MDIISAGNVIGFLMEAREKGYVTKSDLDGIDLTWGMWMPCSQCWTNHPPGRNRRPGSPGGQRNVRQVGRDSKKFAIHVKGLELAAHNIHANPPRALCYATSNRGPAI